MEQAHAGEGHDDAVLVGGVDDVVVADGAARLGDVLHAGLAGAFHVVAEGEEGVAAAGHAALRGDPGFLFLSRQHLGANLEDLLPLAVAQDIVVLVGGVNVNGVVAVGAADAVDKLQAQYLRVLAQVPVVGLLSGKTGAVDAALLSGADADGLPVLDVADGVGLGILEGNEGDDHVDLRLLRQIFVLGHEVFKQALVYAEVVMSLLEGDAEDILALLSGGDVIRVDLHDIVAALFLGLEDFKRLVGIGGGDDAVGDLVLEVGRGRGIAGVAEGRPVAVGAESVGAAGADVGAGDGRELGLLIDEVDDIAWAGDFEGEINTKWPEKCEDTEPLSLNIDDNFVLYIRPAKDADFFSQAYSNPEQMCDEFRNKMSDYLPDDFPFWKYIVSLSGTYYC